MALCRVPLALTALLLAAQPALTQPLLRIPLANARNSFSTNKRIFLGHRVLHFRLQLKFVTNPPRTWAWPPNTTVTVQGSGSTQVFSSLPSSAAADRSFWTAEIPGNRAEITISTPTLLQDFDATRLAFDVVSVAHTFRSGSSRRDTPALPPSPDIAVLSLAIAQDTLGVPPSLAEYQHYWLPPATHARDLSLYLSPFAPQHGNDSGIQLAVSHGSFKKVGENSGWLSPVSGDSGIYHEILVPAQQPTYLTVRQAFPMPYLLTAQNVRLRFKHLRAARHRSLGTPPTIDTASLRANASVMFPYGYQLSRYLRPNATIDRRIRETFVIATAHMLDASEGMFRLADVRLHDRLTNAVTPFVRFRRGDERAFANGTGITMYEEDLHDPISGGWTLHHEWGHAMYLLPDEYIDVHRPPPGAESFASEAIDTNTLMGTRASSEFCSSRNHRWAPALQIDEESNWDVIFWLFQLQQRNGVDSCDFLVGRYTDVLHQLERLISWR